MRIAIGLAALVVAAALVGLIVLSRDSPQPVTQPVQAAPRDATSAERTNATVQPPVRAQDAPPPTEESPQLRAVRSSGTENEPWTNDAAALASKLAPGASTTCYVAGCIIDVPPAALATAQRTLAADTSWTGGKQWIGATLILYRPD